ncbi:cytosolic carboxypeptidase 4-like isoform X2 [Brienomyrus brachyistius]|uniref:cytosolic carboxypeptidase 4-like isoform X2 n=1 Tax=Brienomyrus brachyistius TaxID=42636 RepID=UPI0020B2827E|nr:cytosolic carboxypeptidase 4-like isoform X2 [Brienomyrus brachyistius]XP_048887108.1 cytosolic carboxypeptidase 4-like isoform X2 [Brienomyrus brachyistius]
MATPGTGGLEVLLSSLKDSESTESLLNILNVLDELLSSGTDRRIHYMISKGGSEALLMALLSIARSSYPNDSVLLPLLHLLAKVGHRDRKIGLKAEKMEAVLPMLDLLRQNVKHARRAAACLWVLQVFCCSVSTATLLGKNRGLDIVFKLISPHTTKHTRTVKAATDTFAALLQAGLNRRLAASRGYVSGLLKLYEDWHQKDTENAAVPIRRALLHCLHHVTGNRAGRAALVADRGMELLYYTTQSCLTNQSLASLVEPTVQLMRKCQPKCPVPLSSGHSVYSYPLPGWPISDMPADPQDCSSEDDSDDDPKSDEPTCKELDEDLETDLNKLCVKPEPDRGMEQLGQYVRLCPELHHDFQDLDSGTEEESSDEEALLNRYLGLGDRGPRCRGRPTGDGQDQGNLKSQDQPGEVQEKGVLPEHLRGGGLQSSYLSSSGAKKDVCGMVDRLLEKHGVSIPNHDPRVYTAAASCTKSAPGFSVLAFPDFWGHRAPSRRERMAERKPNVQREKVLEDIRRYLHPEDLINKVVFDLEDPSTWSCLERSDSLCFFSKFESGNLRKAIQVRSHEYDLILNADANCSQHHQWFYFEVSGMEADVPYRFNIINCEKANSQFNYGMQPVLFSVREALEGRPHWARVGSNICYYRNHFCPVRPEKCNRYYTLTFTVTFQHGEDVCYLAYHYPYTYSALQTHLQMLQQSLDPRKVFFQQQNLCNTLAGNPCPLVTITACPPSRRWNDLQQLRSRPYVVLTARVHPGESNASWVMKGSLEFLCSDEPAAQALREVYIFKIIPMLNPDGVINGSHRCSLNGQDLNRQWMKPEPSLSPTIFHAKGLLYYLNSIGRTPLVFCDYHGHSRKKNVFLYGCSVKETLWQSGSAVDTATLKEDPGYRTISKTLDRIAPAFSLNSCNYLVERSRESTARVVVWREMGVLRSYTMESTYNGCDQGIYKGLQTGTGELEEMGLKFCQSLLPLRRNSMLHSRKLISQPSLLYDLYNGPQDHQSHNSFVDDEPPCLEEIEYLNASCKEHMVGTLDAEVDGNGPGSDEDEELQRPERKSRLIPCFMHRASLDTLSQKRGSRQATDISGQLFS